MGGVSRPLPRAGVAVASAALAALLGWAVMPPREVGATVELVDSRAEIARLLASSAGGRVPPPVGLVRRPLPEDVARTFFHGIERVKGMLYDEHMLVRHRPHLRFERSSAEHPDGGWEIRTNALGLREDAEVSEEHPDLRVLVVGDSHVDGLCANADTFPNLLEGLLAARHPGRSIEVLNAGTGAWGFYNYLGALEGFADLAPDVFVVVVYGGNDFQGPLSLHHYHRGEGLPPQAHDTLSAAVALGERELGLVAQYLNQAAYFYDYPGEEVAALHMALAVTDETARLCRERGTELLCVYLPPWAHGQPESCAPLVAEALASVPLPPGALESDERLADAWLAWLDAAGIAAVDLRPPFRAAREPLYWRTDHHLGLAGHRLAAQALLEPVDELSGLGR